MKFEVLPTAEEIEHRGLDPKRDLPEHDDLERQLQEAKRTAGAAEVEAALAEVISGEARPEALLAWMDDLRDPETNEQSVDPVDLQEGMVPDFFPDSQFAGGALDVPSEHVDDAVFFSGRESSEVADVDSDADADYFLALRKRRGDPDNPDGDGGGDDEAGGAPKDKKAGPKPSAKKKAAR